MVVTQMFVRHLPASIQFPSLDWFLNPLTTETCIVSQSVTLLWLLPECSAKVSNIFYTCK